MDAISAGSGIQNVYLKLDLENITQDQNKVKETEDNAIPAAAHREAVPMELSEVKPPHHAMVPPEVPSETSHFR